MDALCLSSEMRKIKKPGAQDGGRGGGVGHARGKDTMFINNNTNSLNNNYENKENPELRLDFGNGEDFDLGVELLAQDESEDESARAAAITTATCPFYNDFTALEDAEFQSSKKIKLLKEDTFLYRRKTNTGYKKSNLDVFSKLSDEIVLNILRHLSHGTLCTLALVSHRFWRLTRDESLWPRLDLGGRYLPQDSLAHIMRRGTRILRLATARICSPVFYKTKPLLKGFTCKLEYLDLSECSISTEDLELFLSNCKHLKKLSLESCELSYGVCREIAQNVTLSALNLCMCTKIPPEGIKIILMRCTLIQSLNVGWTHLSRSAMDELVRHIPTGMHHLNLSGSQNVLNDKDMKQVLMRCPDLVELDISDCLELTSGLSPLILQYGKKLKSFSFSRCFRVDFYEMISEALRKLPRLERVNAFRHSVSAAGGGAEAIAALEAAASPAAIRFNQEPFTRIARPTVGIRRTSIWGIRCRE